jgi:hypothetical protein
MMDRRWRDVIGIRSIRKDNSMSNLQDDERAILARLIPTAHRLQDDLDAFVQWISTLTEQEQSILMARAVRQGQKYTLALSRIEEAFKRIQQGLV